MWQAGTVTRHTQQKEQQDEKKVDWKESKAGQSRITYTGAAQSLHGAKEEREGRTEEKKIEEEERQHTAKHSEDQNERDSCDGSCKTGEGGGQRQIDEKRGETPERQTGPETGEHAAPCGLQPAFTLHQKSHESVLSLLLFFNEST